MDLLPIAICIAPFIAMAAWALVSSSRDHRQAASTLDMIQVQPERLSAARLVEQEPVHVEVTLRDGSTHSLQALATGADAISIFETLRLNNPAASFSSAR